MPTEFENIHFFDELKHISKFFEIDKYTCGVFLSRNLLKNSEDNDDALFFSRANNKIRFGVADGAGGHPRGRDAAFEATKELLKIDELSCLEKLEKCNQNILDLKVGAKSTVAFAQIDGDLLRFYSVGDSEILYWNAIGRKIYSSIPSSISGFKVAAGILDQEKSLEEPDRNIVFSLLGDEFIRIQSTSSFEFKKGQTVLIGSDGLFDNLSHKNIEKILAKEDFEGSFTSMCEACIKQDPDSWIKEDDISFILIRKTKA